MSCKAYRSCGTIRAIVRFDKNIPTKNVEFEFTPDPDHFIRHESKCYAAFVSGSTQPVCIYELLLGNDEHGNRWVSLKCEKDLSLAAAVATAAATQVKVEVEVEVENRKVVAITIPAKSPNAK